MSTKESASKPKKKPAAKKKAPAKKATKPAAKKTTAAKKEVETVVGEKSLVYVDYTGRTKEDDFYFDTTVEEIAKEKDIHKENERYAPMLVAVGWNWLLQSLEEEIVGMKVGESKTVEIPPEKGAGARDPNLIKKIAISKLQKQGVRGYKGEEVTFGRERGVITAVLGRTVRVDFNPPLAGKTLIFDVTVKEIISDPIDKLIAVVQRRIPAIPAEQFKASITGKVITIELPKESRYIENIQYGEIGIASDALKVMEKAKEVRLVTVWPRPEPPKENTT
ncbi:MAG: FKBP-type peptidyl-prolyl cis-trans isomerase [Candidatus Thorarchaeota archaeon]|nr:FKBP-type peptidyl-prolyl cis-trans isomerase [Candidatus Thorarchaeota archaeon]